MNQPVQALLWTASFSADGNATLADLSLVLRGWGRRLAVVRWEDVRTDRADVELEHAAAEQISPAA